MSERLIQLSEQLRAAPSADDFWALCHSELEQNGVKSLCYGVVPFQHEIELHGYTASGFFKTSHPQEWIDAVGEAELFDDELTTEIIVQRPKTVIWQDEGLWQSEATPEQLKQNEIEIDLGLDVGVTFGLAYYDTDVAAVGIGLNMPDIPREEFMQFWAVHEAHLRSVCSLLDNGMRNKHGNMIVGLTPREQDTLTYLSIGLNRDQAAYHLKIHPKTLDKYLVAAREKLNAGTTAHAIAKALVMGLIQP